MTLRKDRRCLFHLPLALADYESGQIQREPDNLDTPDIIILEASHRAKH
jgi:hypothetical protein